ncbi:MAG: hypothetical protein K0S86_1375 [Geminicoccaceae bacterium]|nr:hypothetical protein [Geminicoccaceae bacterium]
MDDEHEEHDAIDHTRVDHVGGEPVPPPTVKMRNAAQQEVNRLLDGLAPERTAARRVAANAEIERHRTPRGCILQAPAGAVSVSWFADSAQGSELGELQVVAWHGKVSRPGSSERSAGAEVVEQLVLRPVDRDGEMVWRADDGTVYSTDALVAHCLELLEERTGGERPSAPPRDLM